MVGIYGNARTAAVRVPMPVVGRGEVVVSDGPPGSCGAARIHNYRFAARAEPAGNGCVYPQTPVFETA
jgi:hypothetical protein